MAQSEVPAYLLDPDPCIPWWMTSDAMQKWVFIQFLCDVFNYINNNDQDCTDLAEAHEISELIRCYGSPERLRVMMTQMICSELETIDCTKQPTCWTPIDLEAMMFYLVFEILWAIALGRQGQN